MTSGTTNRLRIEARPEFAKILRVENPYAAADRDTAAGRINGRFDRLIVQSGTAAGPDVVLRLCILGEVALGGTVFVATGNLLGTAIALALGACLPIAGVLFARAARQRKLRRQMSALVEQLAQSARAGHGLTSSLEAAVADGAAPLADELRPAVRRLRMGVGIEAAFEDLPERTGLESMRVLVAALAAHDREGSDLVALLDRLENRLATLD